MPSKKFLALIELVLLKCVLLVGKGLTHWVAMKQQMTCLLLFGMLFLSTLQPVAAGPCLPPPSMVGFALATLFCMVPNLERGRSRSRAKTQRPAEVEVEGQLFGQSGGWIDPRAQSHPGGSPLLGMNQGCMAPLGVSWDCDSAISFPWRWPLLHWDALHYLGKLGALCREALNHNFLVGWRSHASLTL